MALFDFSIVKIATPWLTVSEPIIGARHGRKLLVFISPVNGGNWRFDIRASAPINEMFIQTVNTLNLQYLVEYKTWGPITEQAWYGNDGGAGVGLSIMEVWQLPGS